MTKPERTFKIGAVSASVFLNEGDEGPFRTITLQRRYKKGDSWESSSSFTASNAPAAIAVLHKALDYLLDQPDSEEGE